MDIKLNVVLVDKSTQQKNIEDKQNITSIMTNLMVIYVILKKKILIKRDFHQWHYLLLDSRSSSHPSLSVSNQKGTYQSNLKPHDNSKPQLKNLRTPTKGELVWIDLKIKGYLMEAPCTISTCIHACTYLIYAIHILNIDLHRYHIDLEYIKISLYMDASMHVCISACAIASVCVYDIHNYKFITRPTVQIEPDLEYISSLEIPQIPTNDLFTLV